ncbi:hypothetical protein CERSUDRAFT_95490 [Gelatoporia subvermispora B]|uniref:Uncharacterized protein n=1 Tax=Ceriporiopsis subvermispora (strain B) TaxID=914234 RepID=M2PLJ5_CERS8|nr:hypothetical protein CERSUDRAFT_95490 [Gelatoporia subvermispora B]
MLRDGLLSPNSKLLAQAQTVLHPQILPNSRPGSMFSVVSAAGSVMTKSGIFKDERDTVRRRHRHRDGKLLRGGIGLTTGLGWSDSEDEDAPSPLTRRLSSRTLSAAARASPHPLARSVSDTLSSAGPGPSKYAGLHAVERRTSSSSVASSAGLRSRSSVSSLRSASSAAPRTGVRFPLGHINEREEALETASETSSLSMPVTPSASAAAVPPRLRKASAESSVRAPYAAPRLRKSSAESSVHSPLRLRKSSAESSAHSPLDSSNRSDGHAQDQLGASPALRASVPRPLRLPQAQASGRYHSTPARPSQPPSSYAPAPGPQRTRTYSGGLQRPQHHAPPASPVPARAESAPSTKPEFSPVSSSSASATSSPSISSPAHSASLPSLARQKPRTGTGMAYRTSSNPTLRPTMMRMPSSSALRASATKGVGVAL